MTVCSSKLIANDRKLLDGIFFIFDIKNDVISNCISNSLYPTQESAQISILVFINNSNDVTLAAVAIGAIPE